MDDITNELSLAIDERSAIVNRLLCSLLTLEGRDDSMNKTPTVPDNPLQLNPKSVTHSFGNS